MLGYVQFRNQISSFQSKLDNKIKFNRVFERFFSYFCDMVITKWCGDGNESMYSKILSEKKRNIVYLKLFL
jgi:hypothetical protein